MINSTALDSKFKIVSKRMNECMKNMPRVTMFQKQEKMNLSMLSNLIRMTLIYIALEGAREIQKSTKCIKIKQFISFFIKICIHVTICRFL